MPLKTRVIVAKGPPKGRAVLDTLIYRAQVYDSDHPHGAPVWECAPEHEAALDAHACANEWLQQNREVDS
jgi:hypothetical protein